VSSIITNFDPFTIVFLCHWTCQTFLYQRKVLGSDNRMKHRRWWKKKWH